MFYVGFDYSNAVWNFVGGSSVVLCGITIISGIIMMLTGANKDHKENLPIQKIEIFCPYCGILNMNSIFLCEYCGSSFDDIAEKLGYVISNIEEENICSYCGGPLKDSSCIACGRSIKQ